MSTSSSKQSTFLVGSIAVVRSSINIEIMMMIIKTILITFNFESDYTKVYVIIIQNAIMNKKEAYATLDGIK